MKNDFIPPLSDSGFKNLFGTEGTKDNLIDLLNAILHEQLGREKIVEVSLNPTENKSENPLRSTTIFDIHCTTDKGHRIIVEMQNNWHVNFDNRLFYYGVEAIARQELRTMGALGWDHRFQPVVCIALCNFKNERFGNRPVNYFLFKENETGRVYGTQLTLVILQLPYFSDDAEKCHTFIEKIIYSLKNMETIQKMPTIPFSQKEGDFFSRIAKRSRYSALNEDERREYDRWRKAENDRLLELQWSLEEGLEKGRAEGRAEGRNEEKWEMAANLMKLGVDLETISKASELSVSDLKSRFNIQ